MSLAHHIVTVSILDPSGASVRGEGDVFSHCCDLSEIGKRAVAKAARERYAARGVILATCEVQIDKSAGAFAVDATVEAA